MPSRCGSAYALRMPSAFAGLLQEIRHDAEPLPYERLDVHVERERCDARDEHRAHDRQRRPLFFEQRHDLLIGMRQGSARAELA